MPLAVRARASAGDPPYTSGVVASILEPVIFGILVMILVILVAFVIGGYLTWRWARRKWHLVRDHTAGRTVAGTWSLVSGRRSPWASHHTWDDIETWTPRRARREMWRAVDAAEAAVRVADRGGAPVAELPSLCRRIRTVSDELDQILRVEPEAAPDGQKGTNLRTQVADVIDAATDVQRAAVAAASDANAPRVAALTRDAGDELACVTAGLGRAGYRPVPPGR